MRRVHRCIQCAIPLTSSATVCGECLKHSPAFDSTIVAADYAPPVDRLVLALKFGNRLELAPLFARMLRDAAEQTTLPEHLIAVPLGPQRLVQRGFNQALEIARPFSRALGVPLDTRTVVRQRDTHAQALLHPDERRRNIRHAFVVPADAIDKICNKHVGIVDDVMTTGETLNEVAATLKRFGASRVTNFVFARTAQR
jgi:ComF family protein